MRGAREILILITSIVVLSNIYPITGLFQFFFDQRHYRYSYYNGSLTFTEYWSRGYEMMKNRHRSCLEARPDLKDKQLYRLFKKDPLAFWRWRLYFLMKGISFLEGLGEG